MKNGKCCDASKGERHWIWPPAIGPAPAVPALARLYRAGRCFSDGVHNNGSCKNHHLRISPQTDKIRAWTAAHGRRSRRAGIVHVLFSPLLVFPTAMIWTALGVRKMAKNTEI